MSEVRRHQRTTASGKTTTVRQHHRDAGGSGGEPPPGTWHFRNREDGRIYEVRPDGSTRPLPDETEERARPPQASEVPPADGAGEGESWWDDGEPDDEANEALKDVPWWRRG